MRGRELARRITALAATVVACLAVPAGAAEISARIAAMDPAATQTLGRGDKLSVRLSYESTEPLRFTVKGFAGGTPVTGVHSNPAPLYPAGQGDAIVWLRLIDSGYLDEVHVQILDAQWQVRDVLSAPVSLFWEDGSGSMPRTAASWVASLDAAQQAMVSSAAQARSDETDAGGSLLVMLMGWSIPAYLILQIYMVSAYRGGWRKAALVPVLLMIPLALYTLYALLAGSNLWPLMLLFLTPLAFLYLVAVGIFKALAGRRAAA
jgi:hypothetical protein